MNIRNYIFVVICLSTMASPVQSSFQTTTGSDQQVFMLPSSSGASLDRFIGIIYDWACKTENRPVIYGAVGLCLVAAASIMQKQNPDFFNGLLRLVESPVMVIQKKFQLFTSGGHSLTWNELASWHNRVAKLFTPLTKATTVLDLSKERRLRSIDMEDGQTEEKDEQWLATVAHIDHECAFLSAMLERRLNYYGFNYQEVPDEEGVLTRMVKAPVRGLKDIGKLMSKTTSLTRDEEIAFGLSEAITYLQELSKYCGSVTHSSAVDKETVKRLMTSACATIEHLGVLVDEVSAADKNRKKLPMTLDPSTTKGFGNGGFGGGYDGAFATA